MAVYKRDMVDINLETGNIHRSFLKHSIGKADSAADHFGVRVFRNGEAVSLTSVSVQGYFRDPQGNNIAITSGNIVSENEAEVVLPQACYNYEGQFCLAIKLIGGGVTGTVRIVDGMVDNTNTGGAVAPTETVPTYQEVLATYDNMVEALEDFEDYKDEIDEEISSLNGALDQKYDELKSEINVFQDDITGDKIVKNQTARTNMTAGILSKNGNVTSSTSAGYFNAPIEVSPGEIITAQKAYYDSNNILTGIINTDIRSCAYFADNTHTFTNNGFDTAKSSFTVPDGIYYIQPTFSGIMTGTYTQIIIIRTTEHGQTNQKILDLLDGDFPSKNLENNY